MPAGRPQRLDADTITGMQPVHLAPDLDHPTDDFVPGDNGREGGNTVGDPVTLDHVQVRTAHTTGRHLHDDLPGARAGIGMIGSVNDATLEGARGIEDDDED